jgi:predicted DNA-binding transcriptional regulator AlpA
VPNSSMRPVEPEVAFIDTSAVARRLGVSVSYLCKARLIGDGPPFVKFGKSVRYSISAVDTWAEQRRRTSTTDVGSRHGSPLQRSDASPKRRGDHRGPRISPSWSSFRLRVCEGNLRLRWSVVDLKDPFETLVRLTSFAQSRRGAIGPRRVLEGRRSLGGGRWVDVSPAAEFRFSSGQQLSSGPEFAGKRDLTVRRSCVCLGMTTVRSKGSPRHSSHNGPLRW